MCQKTDSSEGLWVTTAFPTAARQPPGAIATGSPGYRVLRQDPLKLSANSRLSFQQRKIRLVKDYSAASGARRVDSSEEPKKEMDGQIEHRPEMRRKRQVRKRKWKGDGKEIKKEMERTSSLKMTT